MSLGTSVYRIKFDSNAQTELNPTRREMALFKKIMEETASPAQKLKEQMVVLNRMFGKEKLKGNTEALARAKRALRKEYDESSGALKRAAQWTEMHNRKVAEGKRVTREVETALERYNRKLLEHKTLLKIVSPEVYQRKLRALKAELLSSATASRTFATALTASAAAMMAFLGPTALAFIAISTLRRGLSSIGSGYEEFAKQMARSTAIMNDSPEQFVRMEQAAISASFAVEASASEIAEGFFFLASAGFNVEESIGAIGTVSTFAQAGQFDLATATDLLTDSQKALGDEFENNEDRMKDLVHIGDVLVGANQMANMSVEQFSEALTTKAAASAKAFNVPIEEVVATLAIFANQGVKAADAGTAYGIMMRDITEKSIQFADVWAAAGVTVFDPQTKQRRSDVEIFGDMERALGKLSHEARETLLMDMGFAARSKVFTRMLIGNSEAMDKYVKGLGTVDGITRRTADDSMSTLTKALNKMKAGWGELSIVVGEAFFSGVFGDIDSIEDAFREFNALLEENKDLIKDVGKTAGDYGRLMLNLGDGFTQLIGPVKDANEALGKLFELAGGPEGSTFLSYLIKVQGLIHKIAEAGDPWKSIVEPLVRAWEGLGRIDMRKQGLMGIVRPMAEVTEATKEAGEEAKKSRGMFGDLKDELAGGFEQSDIDRATSERETEAADNLNDAIEKRAEGLATIAFAIGREGDALERAKLIRDGATDSQLRAGDALAETNRLRLLWIEGEEKAGKATLKAAKEAEDAITKDIESVKKMIEALEKKRDIIGKTALEISLMRAADIHATDEDKLKIIGIHREIEAREELLDVRKRENAASTSALEIGSHAAAEFLARNRTSTRGPVARPRDEFRAGPPARRPARFETHLPGVFRAPKPSDDDLKTPLEKIVINTGKEPIMITEVTV